MLPADSDFETQFTFETEAVPIADNSPFQILLLGDWSGASVKTDLELRQPIEIDRDNFEDVMSRLKASVQLDLSNDETSLSVLRFNEIEDFHPDTIFNSTSFFKDLRELRQRLLDKNHFEAAAREIRSLFNQNKDTDSPGKVDVSVSNVSQVSDSKNLLDQILSQSDEPASSFSPSQSVEIQDLLKQAVKPFLVKTDENEQTKLLKLIDESISNLMRRILSHYDFQTLESAWRGLHFLVKQIETGAGLKIYIFDVTKSELADNLKSINSLADSFLYRILSFSVGADINTSPWTLLAGNYSFDCNLEDIALLMRLAKLSEFAEAPFISYIRPETFGISSSKYVENESNNVSFDTNAQKLWTTIRSLPESEYLGLAMPRYLARLPYGSGSNPIDGFNFEEFDSSTVYRSYIWSNPCFICVNLITQSFTKYGWSMQNIHFKELDGFPIYIYQDNNETKTKSPIEVSLTSNEQQSIIDFGLIPLFSFNNSDKIRVLRFQSIAAPLKPLRGKWMT
jgi:type VI secretion system protein ImpC